MNSLLRFSLILTVIILCHNKTKGMMIGVAIPGNGSMVNFTADYGSIDFDNHTEGSVRFIVINK